MGPQSGDLAAFDLTPPPPCEPPVTGVSIRVDNRRGRRHGESHNSNFIRF